MGESTPPLLEMTIGQALDAAVARWPDREALVSVHEGVRLSFAELDGQADALASGLHALGLRRGDRIGIWSPNCSGWAIVQYAAARAGLILVTINPAYRLSELEFSLRKLGVRALIAAERFKTSDYVAMIEEIAPEVPGCVPGALMAARLPELRLVVKIGGVARPGWIEFAELPARARSADREAIAAMQPYLSANDAVNVQFTSGTTGMPKGATLTHRNILNNGYLVGRCIGLQAGDRVCVPVPLYHCFGMVMGNLACLAHGATVVYPAPSFEPVATLAAIDRERCTHVYGVPTMFIALLGHPELRSFGGATLRGGIMAGAPCPIEVMRQVMERMHMEEITIAYGMTETSPVSFQTARCDELEDRISTVGRVQPHLECKVIGPEGTILPRGEAGELCTRGYSVMRGYWGEPERTSEVIDEQGWMHTGDLAAIDDRGYCRIVGRLKDMVIRGGENIYPREIEEFLHTHPDIREVAVVGVPDERFGEEVCAWVRPRDEARLTAEEVISFCRRHIAHFKVPRYVRIVDALPTTVTGKVQKFIIRERMAEELGLRKDATGVV